MNVIFISPNYPAHFFNFCDRLKRLGVNVLGIGDCPYDYLAPEVSMSLNEYTYCPTLENYEDVYRTVASYIARYGRIDYVESQNDYWLELEARIRTDFNITSGLKLEDLEPFRKKSLMKKSFKKAGVKTARHHVIDNLNSCLNFLKKVGFPVVVKPNNGNSGTNLWKIESKEEFEAFFSQRPDMELVIEEYVPGHIETFDGITGQNGEVIFAAGQVLVKTPMEIMMGTGEYVRYTQNVEAMDLYEIGTRLIERLGLKNRFFHVEFFRLEEEKKGLGKKGEIVGLEMDIRVPGGPVPDLMNYSYDIDVYQIWAESLAFGENRTFPKYTYKYYVTQFEWSPEVSYRHSPDEIRDQYAKRIVSEMPGANGHYTFTLRSVSRKELYEQLNFIMAHNS